MNIKHFQRTENNAKALLKKKGKIFSKEQEDIYISCERKKNKC